MVVWAALASRGGSECGRLFTDTGRSGSEPPLRICSGVVESGELECPCCSVFLERQHIRSGAGERGERVRLCSGAGGADAPEPLAPFSKCVGCSGDRRLLLPAFIGCRPRPSGSAPAEPTASLAAGAGVYGAGALMPPATAATAKLLGVESRSQRLFPAGWPADLARQTPSALDGDSRRKAAPGPPIHMVGSGFAAARALAAFWLAQLPHPCRFRTPAFDEA